MTKKKKTNKILKYIVWTIPFVVSIFLITLFVYFWDFIKKNNLIILLITGGLIIFYIILGVLKWKAFLKSIRKKF